MRNGSRGLFWLEPLVEVATAATAASPTARSTPHDVRGLFDAGFLHGGEHALAPRADGRDPVSEAPERLTFARVGVIDPLILDDYARTAATAGLSARWR